MIAPGNGSSHSSLIILYSNLCRIADNQVQESVMSSGRFVDAISFGAIALVLLNPLKAGSLTTADGPGQESLCAKGNVICVAKSLTNSVLTNPFKIDIQVNSGDDIQVGWEIRDGTGEVLESSSTYEHAGSPTEDFTPGRIFHIRDFIFIPAKSEHGTLTLTASRYTIQTGGVGLPGITIPVRLMTANATVRILVPEKPNELNGAAAEWIEGGPHDSFNPKLKLVERRQQVMRFEPQDEIGVTVEAVLRAWLGQEQWHVVDWRQVGTTAHVAIVGGGWAGVSYYGAEVGFLIEKSVLSLPHVRKFVFDPAVTFGY
jgi:hypothetical protein